MTEVIHTHTHTAMIEVVAFAMNCERNRIGNTSTHTGFAINPQRNMISHTHSHP